MLQSKEFPNSGEFRHFGKSVGEIFSTSMTLFGPSKKVSPPGLVCRWVLEIWMYFKNCGLFFISAVMRDAMSRHDLNLSQH